MKKLLFLFTLLTLSYNSYCQGGARYIQFNLKKGKTYTQSQNTSMEIHQQVSGQNIDMTINMKGTIDYTVTGMSGDAFVLKTQYKNMNMSISSPLMSINASSDADEEQESTFSNIMQKALKYMTSKPFSITLKKDGTIEKVEGMDAIYEGFADEVFADMPEATEQMKSTVITQLKQSYGEKAFKGSFEMFLKVLPEEKVKLNDTWVKDITLQAGMEAYYLVKYQFTEATKDHLSIVGKGVFKTADKEAYTKVNGMDAKYDLKGSYHCEYKIDPESGWVIEASIHNNAEGNVVIKPNAQLPDGMDIPMKLKGDTELRN